MIRDISGILIIDKEKGMTSHDVVSLVRRKSGIRKVGHAGTLDPDATGVLVILLGKCTKLSQRFSSEEKEYSAVMKLGEKTDTGDSSGRVISKRKIGSSDREINDAVKSFMGRSEQVPPMVSARKVNGRRLYKLARKGIEVKRKPQTIFIRDIRINFIQRPFVSFGTVCGKGTYIRQLAEDIGEKLGCGAHVTELRRTRSGAFSIEQAVPLGHIRKLSPMDFFNENVIRIQGR